MPAQSLAEGTGDTWRRTAHGWEQIGSPAAQSGYFFTKAAASGTAGQPSGFRLDAHPAVLITFELLAVGFAFLLFPRQRQLTASSRPFPVGDQPRWHSPALIF